MLQKRSAFSGQCEKKIVVTAHFLLFGPKKRVSNEVSASERERFFFAFALKVIDFNKVMWFMLRNPGVYQIDTALG